MKFFVSDSWNEVVQLLQVRALGKIWRWRSFSGTGAEQEGWSTRDGLELRTKNRWDCALKRRTRRI